MSATHRGGVRKKLDRYYTPDACAEALVSLLPVEPGQTAIEPSVGGGAFARALKKRRMHVVGYDIDPEAPGFADCDEHYCLDWSEVRQSADWIVGNPPYAEAETHVRRALVYSLNVAMLLRVGFLEALKRKPFWTEHPAWQVWILSPRPSFTGGGNDATAYAFFCWRNLKGDYLVQPELRYRPPTRLGLVYWKDSDAEGKPTVL